MTLERNLKYLVTSLRRNFGTKGRVNINIFLTELEMIQVLKKNPNIFERNHGRNIVWYELDARPTFTITLFYDPFGPDKDRDQRVRAALG